MCWVWLGLLGRLRFLFLGGLLLVQFEGFVGYWGLVINPLLFDFCFRACVIGVGYIKVARFCQN